MSPALPDIYGPFDAPPDGQAPWAQAQWYRDAPLWAPSGVFGPPAASAGAGDLPLTVNGLTVSLGLGRGHVRGAGYERTGTPKNFDIPANTNTTLARRDRLVLRRDLAAKTVTPVHLQGVPATSPAAPTLQLVENGQWDEPLFAFTVPANSGTVLSAIADERRWIDPNGQGYYPAAAELVQSAAQSINHNAWTPLLLQSEDVDTWNAHSTSSSTTRWTAPMPCLVLASGSYGWAAIAGNTAYTARGVRMHKNGAAVPSSATFDYFQNDRAAWAASKPTVIRMADGDFLDVAVYQASGAPLNTQVNTDIKPGMSVAVLGWL